MENTKTIKLNSNELIMLDCLIDEKNERLDSLINSIKEEKPIDKHFIELNNKLIKCFEKDKELLKEIKDKINWY